MAVHVFSPLYINKDDSVSRQAELDVLRGFLSRIGVLVKGRLFDRFIIIDDGSDPEVGAELKRLQGVYSWIDVRSNRSNLGLCATLWAAYQSFLDLPGDDIVVRLDSDGEHDPDMIPELVARIEAGAGGAVCQVKYKQGHQSDEDRLFNIFAGSIQGKVIFGEPLVHNCPGFNAYTVRTLKAAAQDYSSYAKAFSERFGVAHDCIFDIVMMFLATRRGFSIDRSTFHDSRMVAPNRPVEKILEQSIASARNLILMQEMDKKSGFRL